MAESNGRGLILRVAAKRKPWCVDCGLCVEFMRGMKLMSIVGSIRHIARGAIMHFSHFRSIFWDFCRSVQSSNIVERFLWHLNYLNLDMIVCKANLT